MIAHDNANYPLPHPAAAAAHHHHHPLSTQQLQAAAKELPKYTESEMKSAEALVRAELQTSPASEINIDDMRITAEKLAETLVSLLPKSTELADPTDPKVDRGALVAAMQHEYERTKEAVVHEAKRAGKLEQKLGVVHGGYMQVNDRSRRELVDLAMQLQQLSTELDCFRVLKHSEDCAGPQRVAGLRAEVSQLTEREASLQARYATLLMEKNTFIQAAEAAAAAAAAVPATGTASM